VVRRGMRIIVHNKQGKRIEKGVVRKINKIVVHNRHGKRI